MMNVECNQALQSNIEHSPFNIYRSHSPSSRLRKVSAPAPMPASGSVSRSKRGRPGDDTSRQGNDRQTWTILHARLSDGGDTRPCRQGPDTPPSYPELV